MRRRPLRVEIGCWIGISFVSTPQASAGLESLLADLRVTSWDAIVRVSGLSQLQLEEIAQFYVAAHATVFVYGITQHRRGTETVQCLGQSRIAPRQYRS